MVVNVPGKGNAGKRNGITGNIQVYIEEEDNDTFIRDGQNVIYNLLLDFPTAVLGGQVDIPTIDGTNVKIKIEPGTQRERHSACVVKACQLFKDTVMARVISSCKLVSMCPKNSQNLKRKL